MADFTGIKLKQLTKEEYAKKVIFDLNQVNREYREYAVHKILKTYLFNE